MSRRDYNNVVSTAKVMFMFGSPVKPLGKKVCVTIDWIAAICGGGVDQKPAFHVFNGPAARRGDIDACCGAALHCFVSVAKESQFHTDRRM
jgi:hypothetical protein